MYWTVVKMIKKVCKEENFSIKILFSNLPHILKKMRRNWYKSDDTLDNNDSIRKTFKQQEVEKHRKEMQKKQTRVTVFLPGI